MGQRGPDEEELTFGKFVLVEALFDDPRPGREVGQCERNMTEGQREWSK
jgi:hypothetical protein